MPRRKRKRNERDDTNGGGDENDQKNNKQQKQSPSKSEIITTEDQFQGLEKKRYWTQRYRFWSKFDGGIKMDREGWYTVTPEIVGSYIAERVLKSLGQNITVVDAFSGVGGNATQFALRCKKVIGIDIIPQKAELARHNSSIYKVNHKIDFLVSDYMVWAENAAKNSNGNKFDLVFLSPPWGGPEYINADPYDLGTMEPNGFEIFRLSRKLSENLVYLLPRTLSTNQVRELLKMEDDDECEVEYIYINDRLKMTCCYFGKKLIKSH